MPCILADQGSSFAYDCAVLDIVSVIRYGVKARRKSGSVLLFANELLDCPVRKHPHIGVEF